MRILIVEDEITGAQLFIAGGGMAKLGSHPRPQLVERERLGQVVVRAEVEAEQLRCDVVPGRQDQNGQLRRAGSQRLQHAEPIQTRQPQVEDHELAGAGETVSRERLLSEVWGYTFDPGSNIVDVYIARLRRKLGTPALIETVRHAGYRLAAA